MVKSFERTMYSSIDSNVNMWSNNDIERMADLLMNDYRLSKCRVIRVDMCNPSDSSSPAYAPELKVYYETKLLKATYQINRQFIIEQLQMECL